MCPFLKMSLFSEINIPYSHTAERQIIFSISACNSEMLRLEVIAKLSGQISSEGLSKGHHWNLRMFQDSGFSIACKVIVCLLVCYQMQRPDPVALRMTLLASVGLLRDRDCRIRFSRMFDKWCMSMGKLACLAIHECMHFERAEFCLQFPK